RGRRGSRPYPTISRGARTARTMATSCGCCIGPRISTSSRRSAPALGHHKHGEGSYPLSTHRHTCDSTSPSGSHSTCTAIGHAPTVQMCFIFPIRDKLVPEIFDDWDKAKEFFDTEDTAAKIEHLKV